MNTVDLINEFAEIRTTFRQKEIFDQKIKAQKKVLYFKSLFSFVPSIALSRAEMLLDNIVDEKTSVMLEVRCDALFEKHQKLIIEARNKVLDTLNRIINCSTKEKAKDFIKMRKDAHNLIKQKSKIAQLEITEIYLLAKDVSIRLN